MRIMRSLASRAIRTTANRIEAGRMWQQLYYVRSTEMSRSDSNRAKLQLETFRGPHDRSTLWLQIQRTIRISGNLKVQNKPRNSSPHRGLGCLLSYTTTQTMQEGHVRVITRRSAMFVRMLITEFVCGDPAVWVYDCGVRAPVFWIPIEGPDPVDDRCAFWNKFSDDLCISTSFVAE